VIASPPRRPAAADRNEGDGKTFSVTLPNERSVRYCLVPDKLIDRFAQRRTAGRT